jgi:hypothetical protein
MTHLTESTLEETALEWLDCQRILALVDEVRVKDVEKNL